MGTTQGKGELLVQLQKETLPFCLVVLFSVPVLTSDPLFVRPSERPPGHTGQVPHPLPLLLGLHVLGQPGVTLHLPLLAGV